MSGTQEGGYDRCRPKERGDAGAQPGSHQRVVSVLLRQLVDAAPSGWLALPGIAISAGSDSPVPDLAVVRALDPLPVAWEPADVCLVVELIIPGRRRFDMVIKRETYTQLGIPCYWVIDPTDSPPRLVAFAVPGHGCRGGASPNTSARS